MARMHSRKKGKSGSERYEMVKKKAWVRYGVKEIESLIVKLGKAGKRASEIGLILRDSYGIPDVKIVTNERITKMLEKNKIEHELPEDLSNLIKRQIQVDKHLNDNHKDVVAKRGLMLTESKINRLVKYYKSNGKLSKDWKYDAEKAKLLTG
ncbi:MAG: 30S ribosomal protein S15 [Candidatus Woesearchaeota archaeon]